VLVVVADVVGEHVQRSVVRVRLVPLRPLVVLCHEVRGQRVEGGTHEG